MRRRGFSLVMVLVMLALVTFILIPLFTSFHGSKMGAEKSVNYLIAANLITSQLEVMRSMPFSELEAYILGIKSRPGRPVTVNRVNGPFETEPERPDIMEKEVFTTGAVVFDRYTFLSYFPRKNPDPGNPEIMLEKQRIRIRVDILWREPVPGKPARGATMTASTMVHNENFNPRPSLYQAGQRPPGAP